jgi:hypothetical protein
MAVEGLRFLIQEAQVEHLLKSPVKIMPRHPLGQAKAHDNVITKLLVTLPLASTHIPANRLLRAFYALDGNSSISGSPLKVIPSFVIDVSVHTFNWSTLLKQRADQPGTA